MVKYSYDGNLKFITKKYSFNDWIRVRLRMGDTRKQAEKTWELAGYMNRIFLLEGQDIVAAKTSKKRNRDAEYPLLSAAALRTGDDSPAVEVTRDVVVIDWLRPYLCRWALHVICRLLSNKWPSQDFSLAAVDECIDTDSGSKWVRDYSLTVVDECAISGKLAVGDDQPMQHGKPTQHDLSTVYTVYTVYSYTIQ